MDSRSSDSESEKDADSISSHSATLFNQPSSASWFPMNGSFRPHNSMDYWKEKLN